MTDIKPDDINPDDIQIQYIPRTSNLFDYVRIYCPTVGKTITMSEGHVMFNGVHFKRGSDEVELLCKAWYIKRISEGGGEEWIL